jgi:ParB/RepB/Spo0J family partition protein
MEPSLNPDKGIKERGIEFRRIATGALRPNPWNPNRMSAELAKKLAAEIKKGGMILPIVVRPLPGQGGQSRGIGGTRPLEYQIIDGEHRWLVAKELGMESVPAVVVELSESEARLKTIQLNRLKGEDEPELLARLLRELNLDLGLEEMLARLPFDRVELEQTMELVELLESSEVREKLDREMNEMLKDRVFSVIVSEEEKATIERAIHFFNSRCQTSLRAGSALAKICEGHLKIEND